jgi:hypothetical protein
LQLISGVRRMLEAIAVQEQTDAIGWRGRLRLVVWMHIALIVGMVVVVVPLMGLGVCVWLVGVPDAVATVVDPLAMWAARAGMVGSIYWGARSAVTRGFGGVSMLSVAVGGTVGVCVGAWCGYLLAAAAGDSGPEIMQPRHVMAEAIRLVALSGGYTAGIMVGSMGKRRTATA